MSVVVSWLAFPLGSSSSHPRRVMSPPPPAARILVRTPHAAESPGRSSGLASDDGPGEVEQLRTEVRNLKSELARERQQADVARRQADEARAASAGAVARARPRLGWRGPVCVLLIVIGCVLAPVSVLGVWAANQVSNTSKYVENVAPLITEPAVQGALTDKISSAVSKQIDVQGVAKRAAAQLSRRGLTRLGALLSSFSGSIAGAVDGLIHSTVAKIVTNPVVARLWIHVNRAAHAQLVRARSAYRLLTTLKWLLPVLTIVLLGSVIYVARRHRRALIGAGVGLAASMLVLGAALAVGRAIYLNKIPSSVLPADAASVVFDTIVRFIRQGLRVLLVLGLVVALAGFFTGPSVTAVRTRAAFRSAFETLRGGGERVGITTGRVGAWVYGRRLVFRIASVAVACLVFVFWTDP